MKATITKDQRLYNCPVPVIGLTGGIASGKSSVSKLFIENGLCLIDADKLIKEIYSQKLVKDQIFKILPEAIKNGEIQFSLLREKFFNEPTLKSQIESIVYPQLPAAFNKSLGSFKNPSFVIYDVPLLFEKNMQDKFDLTVLVYAPFDKQISRLMSRDKISEDLAKKMLSAQMDIELKKKLAKEIIDNSGDIDHLKNQVLNFIKNQTNN